MRLPAWTAWRRTSWWLATLLLSLAIPIATAAQPAASRLALAPFAGTIVPEALPPVPEWWRDGGPRLRPTDRRIARFLEQGAERSARLRGLIRTIDDGDVIVYLSLDSQLNGGLAGRLTFMGRSATFRFVRVELNATRPVDQILAALGHELQHVVEVMEAADVVDEASLLALYQRIGTETSVAGRQGWETQAAFKAGLEVRRQIAAGSAVLARRLADDTVQRR
jgi:hypothetical protein